MSVIVAKKQYRFKSKLMWLVVMVCGIGRFSKYTTLYLKSLGYRNVRSMKGGVNEWVRKGQATESGIGD